MKQCFSPISVPRPNGRGPADRISVPCGKCDACLLNKAEDWTNRAKIEMLNSTSAFFVTLTYSDQNLPFDPERETISLIKGHYQGFLKRLRKNIDTDRLKVQTKEQKLLKVAKIRFICVGEYGHKTKRPHYHLLIFNIPNYSHRSLHEYALTKIEQAWRDKDGKPIGLIHVGTVEMGALNYVCSYMLGKKSIIDAAALPPFMETSRRCGIGQQYVAKYKNHHQNTIGNTRLILPAGEYKRMPSYLARKIWSEQEREHIGEEKKRFAEKKYNDEVALALQRGSTELDLIEERKRQCSATIRLKLSKK